MTPKTCSRENGARLAELGVAAGSCFFCWECVRSEENGTPIYEVSITHHALGSSIPAPTVGELGEMLPDPHKKKLIADAFWAVRGGNSDASILYLLRDPDLVCGMLIWLLEQGLITKEEVNG